MKKLFALLCGLMFITNIFGQPTICEYSFIEKNGYVESSIHSFKDNLGDYSWLQTIHFIKNGFLYVLAYEPLEKESEDGYTGFVRGVRGLYLYRKDISNIDNPWIISSDVIITNYIYSDEYNTNFSEIDFNTKNIPTGTAEIIQNNDEYTITLELYVFNNNGCVSTELLTFTLTPAKNKKGFYWIKERKLTKKE